MNNIRTKRRNATSRYHGVFWDAWAQRWGVVVRRDIQSGRSRQQYVGRYKTQVDAARAADLAMQLFTRNPTLNFPH